ncbi:hypothetical protein JQ633_12505 [Bradyrhizobium tropiciagri]|uniref:hypothetical protein n=1 Tax=Bradyrhizobium tropiciagri TaxID=312253 RepID=UPI001BA708F0|nr:hypothetical protein [Bradyrhizobium tropiciagri]MBR0871184.1 hypothetical protein [Bradyrhizobium tropiciagri]
MACRCNERREAIVRIVKSASVGKTEDVVRNIDFVVKSSAEDTAAMLRQSIAAARLRLIRR